MTSPPNKQTDKLAANPKYVIVDLTTGLDQRLGKSEASSSIKNPTVFNVTADRGTPFPAKNNDPMQEYLIQKLKQHVQRWGTINEIVFSGHGSPERMNDRSGRNPIAIPHILEAISRLEKELGKKITHRIVFSGCETLARLPEPHIQWYRDYAKDKAVEIAGTTSLLKAAGSKLAHLAGILYEGPEAIFTGKLEVGRAICFTSQGEVKRDKTDDRYNIWALVKDDRTWVDHHMNHTHEQATQAMQHDVRAKISDVLAKANIDKTPQGFGTYTNNSLSYHAAEMAKHVTEIDKLNPRIGVLFAPNLKQALVATSDNRIEASGIPLHRMTSAERSKAIQAFKEQIATISRFDLTYNDSFERALAKQNRLSNSDTRFTAVLLNDKEHALIVTEKGAYEVVDIGPGSPPPLAPTATVTYTKPQSAPKHTP